MFREISEMLQIQYQVGILGLAPRRSRARGRRSRVSRPILWYM